MTRKLNLPKILQIKLNGFSLYTLQPNIEVEMGSGVFCLAGANGLGKSTFLTALNYAITGIVHSPNSIFRSADEYYSDEISANYSSEYFSGRIAEDDRDTSSISVRLQVGEKIYEITRGVFEPSELQAFTVNDKNRKPLVDTQNKNEYDKNTIYQEQITKDIGIGSFELFVFLQLFVFTFDESRSLLLWDKRALNTAIHLCVGADFKKVQESEKLFRDMEKFGSKGRNYSWQASIVRKDIEIIREALGLGSSTKEIEEVGKEHRTLSERLEAIENLINQKQSEFNDAQLKWSEANSELATLQVTYTRQFNSRLQKRTRVELHPTIATSLDEEKCAICGSHSVRAIAAIRSKIENSVCPLCESELPKSIEDKELLATLKDIDKSISNTKKQSESLLKTMERARAERIVLEKKREDIFEAVNKFEKANENALYKLKAGFTDQDSSLQSKLESMNDFLQKKKVAYAERDKKRQEYLAVQKELARLYDAAQDEFVPLFRNLARLFLGIDVDIRVEFGIAVESLGFSLILEMQGTVRRQDQQLSESQRFFVDIALRMAIGEYMAEKNTGASLFIDTPEGSLDIAYEGRVGQMFAEFVNKENNIIMTANINSSQILLRLATMCGREKMKLQKMTTWTELSEVQAAAESLFTKAFNDIEAALVTPA